ncbi:maleylpyruvate isomerase family mycothiol-dependent enzyme [Actinoplanes friuliensis]|uniref:Mycothiol-dependent maleylpyruvate isomerase metal-binding domain-containing protein n=1 Tax=Actinoplanes friuliensis DSM 7358 TaxID=1246995 RepID=U5W3A1_9ACTN|nr:maleylpyruvate isomerase family mycothiol-dependent enzyme [Actinoplanes friuliensis]AGZ43497.1 hypothetical protein AFR_26175 [Actinoplanes friuliensis DSM 7358]
MDHDEVWKAIDTERAGLADLFESLTPQQWETPSLCEGWRVRDVAAHLTLSQTGLVTALLDTVRARGSLSRMIRDSARRQAVRVPPDRYAALLRAMAGSRRTAPGVTPLEPLIDVLVHGQDIALPLGLRRPMPVQASAAAADRVWPDLWPFRAERRLRGFSFRATDDSWSAGAGPVVEGSIGAILLLLTGRRAALDQLSGPGAEHMRVTGGPGTVQARRAG